MYNKDVTEGPPNAETPLENGVAARQYEGYYGTNADIRLNTIDKLVADGRNLRKEMVDDLDLQYNGLLVDIACSRGGMLIDAYIRRGYQGRALGVDIDETSIFSANNTARKMGLETVSFITGDMDSLDNLPIEDGSVDNMLCSFAIYHANHPLRAVEVMHQKLKSSGQLIISTNDAEEQKPWHRQILKCVSETMGLSEPIPFAKKFNKKEAYSKLSQFFPHVREVAQRTEMVLGPNDFDLLLMSLSTYFKEFSLPNSINPEWREKVRKVAKWFFDTEINSNGYLREPINRAYYDCRKAST